jgi:hypothetical protein
VVNQQVKMTFIVSKMTKIRVTSETLEREERVLPNDALVVGRSYATECSVFMCRLTKRVRERAASNNY